MKIGVVGTGYVGLVSGVCLAAKGHDVTCVDLNLEIVSGLNEGIPHIYEKGLPELLGSVISDGNFRATSDLESVLQVADTILIAVGTPSENGVIDLRYVKAAARSIGNFIGKSERHISVLVKSTVIPGTTDTIVREEIEAASGKKFPAFGLGMNPEFLREGEAIEDFMFPDRVVLGYEDDATLKRLESLYAPWDVPKLRVNTRTAELIKYANNALLAMQISGINEIANLAAAIGGIDVMDVVSGVHLDKRWNPIGTDGQRANPRILSYLVPGCGFGGSCFPKDVQALRSQGESRGVAMHVLNAVLNVNDVQPLQVLHIIERQRPVLLGAKVLVLGLAFKPETDDVRESASIKIIAELVDKGACIVANDPIATNNFKKVLGARSTDVKFSDDWKAEVATSEIIIVATAWTEYLELKEMTLQGKILFDARRMFSVSANGGAQYLSIGLRQV